MPGTRHFLPWFAFVVVASAPTLATGLKPETLAAWEQYIETVDARAGGQSSEGQGSEGRLNFLSIDADAEDNRPLLQAGQVIVSQLRAPAVPNALVHHWIGTIFIPGVTLAQVLAVERDYDRYPQWFGPTITHANLLERVSGRDHVVIRYQSTVLFITTVVEAEFDTQYVPVGMEKLYAISRSLGVREVHDVGKPEESRIPADDVNAFLWRLHQVARYEEADNGVYVEQETIGLSRRIPAALRWLIEPAVRHFSHDMLKSSLERTRAAVLARSKE